MFRNTNLYKLIDMSSGTFQRIGLHPKSHAYQHRSAHWDLLRSIQPRLFVVAINEQSARTQAVARDHFLAMVCLRLLMFLPRSHVFFDRSRRVHPCFLSGQNCWFKFASVFHKRLPKESAAGDTVLVIYGILVGPSKRLHASSWYHNG
jgi:hypothetical protein